MRTLVPVVLYTVLTLAGTADSQEQAVAPQFIKETWVGKPMLGATAAGAPARLVLAADGTASISAGATNDTGTWRISEQGYCTTWKTIRAGQERCFTVRRANDRFNVFDPDGSLSGYFNVTP